MFSGFESFKFPFRVSVCDQLVYSLDMDFFRCSLSWNLGFYIVFAFLSSVLRFVILTLS